MKKLLATTFVLATFLSAGAEAQIVKKTHYPPAAPAEEGAVNDPIEPINRAIFEFNNVVDGVVLKPVSQVYRGVVPQWGRERVSNVLYNLGEPVTVLNSTLQGDGQNAFTSLWRFIFNSTFGLLGVFDVATELGLKSRSEDFGQTLYVWGATESPYLVLPILGPSTLRDGVGTAVDYVSNPWHYNEVTGSHELVTAYIVARGIDKRTELLPTTDNIERTALDKYAAYRSMYLQNRLHDYTNGKSDD